MIAENHLADAKWPKKSFFPLVGNHKAMIFGITEWLSINFEIKEIGIVEYILGVKIFKETYINKVLECFQIS